MARVGNSRYIAQRLRGGENCCAWCWTPYDQTRFDQRYCSGRCRVAALRARRRRPFSYTYDPQYHDAPQDETLDALVVAVERRWPSKTPSSIVAFCDTVLDWLSPDANLVVNSTAQDVIDVANDLAYHLGRRHPIIAYPLGTHPENDYAEGIDERQLPRLYANRRRWAYRAWLAELDEIQQHVAADALITAWAVAHADGLRARARVAPEACNPDQLGRD
jgi:hypothetical protein